ncbi:hypothetical protein HCN44_001793 [Aphidius gifuensis]|uniref:FHA domain-containing protein n=1 Tax=Aphidius gifuensis TaxID=684658 RepID=A0A835CMI9_APHGI|nr:hypothetical protein HCN44_001793 [Aphidius gifuensis]
MWCIKEKKNIDNFYNIKPGDKFTIGRKGTDIILENDGSRIARMHAFIEVKKQDDNSTNTNCLLTDVGSRYGTQIISNNSIKLETNKPQELRHNDTSQFGLNSSINLIDTEYRIVYNKNHIKHFRTLTWWFKSRTLDNFKIRYDVKSIFVFLQIYSINENCKCSKCLPGLICSQNDICVINKGTCESQKWEEPKGLWTPCCDKETGDYCPRPCKRDYTTGRCFCYNSKGSRIFGSAL